MLPKFIRNQIDCPHCKALIDSDFTDEFFIKLRSKAIKQSLRDMEQRLSTKPVPTQNELRMGVFVEMLEPQVRQAVIEMNKKGYLTESSGFVMGDPTYQEISGTFSLDPETEQILEDLEISVMRHDNKGDIVIDPKANYHSTALSFVPQTSTLDKISDEWLKIVAHIPINKNEKKQRNNSKSAIEFRKVFLTAASLTT